MTKLQKIVIKFTGLRDRTPSKMVNFQEKRAITLEGMAQYESLLNLKNNNVTKFHRILNKTTGLIDRTPSKMVNFHAQRTINPECMMRYRPLLNLKKTLWYQTM